MRTTATSAAFVQTDALRQIDGETPVARLDAFAVLPCLLARV
jgi:hypothetical protein